MARDPGDEVDETDAQRLLERVIGWAEDVLGTAGVALMQWQRDVLIAVLDGAHGPVETTVRDDVGALITEHPMGESLAAMSFNLARVLDGGAGLAVAAVNRELRANLVELAGMGVSDDDLGDDLSEPTPPAAGLPTEVRDTETT